MERIEIELTADNQRAQIREHLPAFVHIEQRAAFGGGVDTLCTDRYGAPLGKLIKIKTGNKTFLVYYK